MSKGKFYERKDRESWIESDIRSYVMQGPNGFAFYSGLFCRRINNMPGASSWQGNIGGIDVALSSVDSFAILRTRGNGDLLGPRYVSVQEAKDVSRGGVRGPLAVPRMGNRAEFPRTGARSHVSRDVQERVVVVLDRGFLVALVVHFKSRLAGADGSLR